MLCSTFVSTWLDLFRLGSTYVLIVLDLYFEFRDQNRACFDCARLMFRPCSTYASTVFDLCYDFFDRNWVCLEFLDLCFEFPDKSGVCFASARPIFQLSRPKLGMLRHLNLCFDFLDLSFYTLNLCIDFLDKNWVCFDFVFDLKLLLDRRTSVTKLHLLDFQCQNVSRTSRPE